ncbi:MAG: hypothetical protein HYW16_00295 [Candidatus Rokubacteria bacterium]|nr:hypothetical protein [Candidatus Rokubacteria bacterium]
MGHDHGVHAAGLEPDRVEPVDQEVVVREAGQGIGAEETRHRARSQAGVEEELGDLLFSIANLARKLGIEPESALRRANEKFTRRFEELERRFAAGGRVLADVPLADMEAEWGRVKRGV